jgi:flagellar basal-body rod protein FlgB
MAFNLPDIPIFSVLRERMAWLNQRQTVLSDNVANADTPGYVARDLKPLDFEKELQSASIAQKLPGLTVTDPRHIVANTATGSSEFSISDTPDVEANPNGNAVSLEQEMIKVSDTQMQFQAAANLYGKAMTLMKTAIGQP